MAWNASNSYPSTTFATNTIFNALANDDRTWGGNVDAGGNALANCLSIAGPAGANPLVFNTNGAERMRLTGTGPVCIGTTTPPVLAPTLTVQSIGSSLRVAAFVGTGTDTGVQWVNTQTGGKMYSIYASGGPSGLGQGFLTIYDDTATAPRFAITNAGNILLYNVPIYANNAAAAAGGLVAGTLYRTGANPDPVCIVH